MELEALISGLDVRAPSGLRSIRVCDITEDSRTVLPGSLFIARRGLREDGRKYIPDALAAGAVAVLTDDPEVRLPQRCPAALLSTPDVPEAVARIAERFYGEPSSRLTLVGVTGTNGKTTTATLVHRILNASGVRCGLMGTVEIDDGREVAPAHLTTLPAAELSRTLATMVESGCRAAAMEVSSHALDQKRASALRFGVGVFTNLTGDHLDYHKTLDAYAAAKRVLFSMLPADGTAIVNAEDPRGEFMAAGTKGRVVRCMVDPARPGDAEARAEILSMEMAGTRARFLGPWGAFEATLPLIGRHNVMNALQAAAAAHAAAHVSAPALASALSEASPPAGRLERVTNPSDPWTVLVDYAHSDDALEKVLGTLGPLVPRRGEPGGGRLWVVFGCGGDRDRTKRPRMGAVAVRLADVVVVTSDNPRTESPGAIIGEILGGIDGSERHKVTVQAEREAAIRHAVSHARAGDVVLIAGKGHETSQILPDGKGGTVERHFDDREVARAALADRRPRERAAKP